MPDNNLKNIVVLKNLPSNLVDEAIVILKSNKYAKKLQRAEKTITTGIQTKEVTSDYVIKEAESVIANYISKLDNKSTKKSNKNIEEKYKQIKAYSVFVSIFLAFLLFRALF